MNMVERAREMSKAAHAGQTYGNGEDYFEKHIMEVVNEVYKYTNHETMLSVAYLHDAVEDTDLTLQDVADEFPSLVVFGVDDMTHDAKDDYMEYLWKIGTFSAVLVKYCDMTVNLRNNPSAKNKMKYEMGLSFLRLKHASTLRAYGVIGWE